jgi:hypothetical protein
MRPLDQIPDEIHFDELKIPSAYFRVFELGLTNIAPWRFIEGDEFQGVYGTLRELYPPHYLLPFARREDNDDVACFVASSPQHITNEVVIVHLFASEDYAIDGAYPSFWDWFRNAVDEMIEMSP